VITITSIIRTTKVSMMLADHAQAAEGKLNIIGGGWTVTGPGAVPFAIAISIEMPWSEAGIEHQFKLELVDSNGVTVEVPAPDGSGSGPLVIQGAFPLAAAPGVPRGTPLTTPIALNFAPAPPIAPGGRYEWRLEVDGETHEDWRLGFATRPMPQSKAA
jgi:hypothetical protein